MIIMSKLKIILSLFCCIPALSMATIAFKVNHLEGENHNNHKVFLLYSIQFDDGNSVVERCDAYYNQCVLSPGQSKKTDFSAGWLTNRNISGEYSFAAYCGVDGQKVQMMSSGSIYNTLADGDSIEYNIRCNLDEKGYLQDPVVSVNIIPKHDTEE